MKNNALKWAIAALLVLNLVCMATLLLRGRPEQKTAVPDNGSVTAAPRPQETPVPPPPMPKPIQLLRAEQMAMSSNRLARVRLHFSGPVDTNSLAGTLGFKADGAAVRHAVVATDGQSVVLDLLDPVPGSLVLATMGEGTLPAASETLLLPSVGSATVGCSLSARLAVRSIYADQTSFGSRICVELNQPATSADAASFIHVSPPAEFSVGVSSGYWQANLLTLSGDFKCGTEYTVEVDKGLRSRLGETLLVRESAKVKIPSLKPTCEFASSGRYLPPSDTFVVPVRVVNVTNLHVTAAPLLPENIVHFIMRETGRYEHWYNWDDDDNDNAELLLGDWEKFDIPVRAKHDEPVVIPCSLDKMLGKRGRGAYLVAVEPQSDRGDVGAPRKVVCFSDIGLSLLVDDDAGVAYVWVTTLSTGAARQGVEVSLYSQSNECLGKATSDASGLAKIPYDREKKTVVAVVGRDKADGDLSFVSVANETSVSVSKGGERDHLAKGNYEAFVFTDRGIFRPGETVFLQALLRDNRAAAPSAIFPLDLEIDKPDGRLYRRLRLMPDARGSLKAEIPVPEYLPSGRYRARLLTPGDKRMHVGDCYFLVESFVPPQIKVSVAPGKDAARPGEKISATVASEHLYGAPAEGLRAECGVTFLPLAFKPAGWEGYAFGDETVKFNGGAEMRLGNARLDADGRRALSFDVPGDLRAPARAQARIRGTVFEGGGRPVTAYGTVAVDTAPYYIGIVRGQDWLKVGQNVSIQWGAARPDGAAEPGVDSLKASLIRIDSHWNFTVDSDGNHTWHCEKTETEVLSGAKVPAGGADGKGTYTFRVPDWGDYRLVLSDTKTGASSSFGFFASEWGGDRPSDTASFTKLDISADKERYAPGDTATIRIRAPFAGQLLLVLKQDKVLQTRSVAVADKSVEIALPVTASIAPGLDVVACLVRSAKPEEVWAPHRAIGRCFVSVMPPERGLGVEVSVPEVIRPSARTDVAVRVSQAGGAAPEDARVTLFAVDEGICGLTDLKTPDPTGFFFAKRFCCFDYYDVYSRLMRVTDSKLTGFLSHVGGDDALDFGKRLNPVSARRFRPVSLKIYDVAVTNGVAVIPVDVPEFTGQLRFMAVAWTASATGSGEAFARVRRELVVQPDLPRVLAPGDKTFLSISLDNTTSSTADIAIAVECEGPVAVVKVPAPFSLAGHSRRTFTVPIEAADAIGAGRVSVRVDGAGETFADTIEIPVRPAAPWETTGESAALKPGESVEFMAPTGILASSASQLVEILPRPSCDIRAALGYLTSYPYGCAEQTTSGAYPFLYAAKLPEGYIDEELRLRADAFVNAAIVRDLTMLRYGGFAMWPDSNSVSSFATLYVAQFLAEARKAGYAADLIDVNAIKDALDLLRWNDCDRDELCHVALDLALLGKANMGIMSGPLEDWGNLSVESRAKLARSFTLAGDPGRARSLLEKAGVPTNLRAAAYLLSAWVELDPMNPRCAECIAKINAFKDGKSGHWGTTQDNALAINALVAYAAALGRDDKPVSVSASLSVLTGERPETVVFPKGVSAKWSSSAGQGDSACRVTNTGDATCYIRRAVTAVPVASALPKVSDGMKVSREYLDREGRAINPEKLRQGDVVVVHLSVTPSDDRDDIVVEDLLPACLEVECHNLVTGGGLAWLPQSDDWKWVSHAEFRDDRVLLFSGEVEGGDTLHWHYSARVVSAGEYIVPAVQASAMYDPRVLARGEPSRFAVEK